MITGKNTQKLASVTGVAVGATSNTYQLGSDVGASLVYSISAAGTFTIEGRVSPDAPWVPIITAVVAVGAEDKQVAISRMLPEVRLNQSAGAGTLQGWVQA